MQEVRLETTRKEYVATGLLPPFDVWPEVVFWGTRVFKIQAPHPGLCKWKLAAGEVPVYQEVFAVAIVQIKEEG